MSSTFSSTKAQYDSINGHNGGPQSRSATVSERSTPSSKHSKTSKCSSKVSSRKLSASVSNASDVSPSKPNSRTPSIHSPKPSYQHKPHHTLAEILTDGQADGESPRSMLLGIERYIVCPTRSNLHDVSTTTTKPEVEYKMRMQALLNDLGTHLDVGDVYTEIADTPVEMYDTQLDLDEYDSE